MESKYKSWKLKFFQNKNQIFYFENVEIGTEVLLQTFYCLFFLISMKMDVVSSLCLIANI